MRANDTTDTSWCIVYGEHTYTVHTLDKYAEKSLCVHM